MPRCGVFRRGDEDIRMSRTYSPVSLIGAPTDVGAGHRGARLGPEALRIAGLGEALVARGVDARAIPGGSRSPVIAIWPKWWRGIAR